MARPGTFQPGRSGNPGGRPKDTSEFRVACRERTERALEVLTDVLAGVANGQAAEVKDMIKAAEILLAYGHGKPTQIIEADLNVRTDIAAILARRLKATEPG